MNIIFLTPVFSEIHIMKDLGRIPVNLKKLNHNVQILTTQTSDNIHLNEIEGINIIKVGNISASKSIYSIHSSLFSYVVRNRKKIDCLIIFGARFNNILTALIYRLVRPNGIIYIKMDSDGRLYSGSPPFQILKKIVGYIYFKVLSRTADLISIETPEAMERIAKIHHFLGKKLIVIPNGVDRERFDQIIDYIKNKEKEYTILYVGRIEEGKGVDLLIHAFLKLNLVYPEWKLKIIGKVEPHFKNELKELLKGGTQNNIEIKGFVELDELIGEYLKAGIFCFPSKGRHSIGAESFGLVLIEAAYCGNAIISSSSGAAEYVLDYGKAGLIFENENLDDLTSKLEIFMKDEELREKMGNNARKRCQELFVWDSIIYILNNQLIEMFSKKER